MAAVGFGLSFAGQRLWPDMSGWLIFVISVGCALTLTVLTILFFFFRDPERHAPQQPGQIVSPADGRVVYIKEIQQGKFPFAVKGHNSIPLREFATVDLIPDRGIQIGIAMNFLNVHVNRSPIGGQITMARGIPGVFASLKHIASLLENERFLMVTEGHGLRVGIVQIASRLVRRIVPYVAEGDQVEQGQRVGMIRFGSQVDVLLAHRDDLHVLAQVGDEVTAGETVLMTCRELSPSASDAQPDNRDCQAST